MTHLGIDWVAMAVIAAAIVFGQLRFVPVKVRFGGVALACFAIAAYKLRGGAAAGPNLIFVGVSVALGVNYLVRAFRGR